MEEVSEDVLGIILKRLDVVSAINLLTSTKKTSKKTTKYVYPRFWFDYDDLIKGKYKEELVKTCEILDIKPVLPG